MRALVTGAAGFIVYHTALKLTQRGDDAIGFEVVNTTTISR